MIMLKKYLRLILIIFLLTTGSCLSSMGENALPQKPSAEELKIIQVKTYNNLSCNKAMKAALNVLQNECYFLEQTDSEAGFVLASREFDAKDKYIDIRNEFECSNKFMGIKRFFPFSPSYSRTEASINITTENDKTTVRTVFRKKLFNLYDATIKVKDITDNAIYSKFYSELDEELQIKNNK